MFQNSHLHAAACLHALCQSEADSIRAYGLRNPICVIPNGIDLPAPGDASASFAAKIPSTAKVLLYLGRLHPKKGLPDLIRAWPAAGRDWHLVIAGWDQGGHENELKKLVAELGLERVHFPGPQFGPAKDAAYRRADAFILPSLSEGLPMVILEAWAHGKPVLMTSACNLPEGFTARAAIQITPDSEGIARGLGELAAMSLEENREMGTRGRRLAEECFAWPKIAESFHAVYQWILGQGPQPERASRGSGRVGVRGPGVPAEPIPNLAHRTSAIVVLDSLMISETRKTRRAGRPPYARKHVKCPTCQPAAGEASSAPRERGVSSVGRGRRNGIVGGQGFEPPYSPLRAL